MIRLKCNEPLNGDYADVVLPRNLAQISKKLLIPNQNCETCMRNKHGTDTDASTFSQLANIICIENDIKYDFVSINLPENDGFVERCLLYQQTNFLQILLDSIKINGYIQISGIRGNFQLKKIMYSSDDSYELQTYVTRKDFHVLFPEDKPDSLVFYYSAIRNDKRWYIRWFLRVLLRAGLKRYIYNRLSPYYVSIIFKKGNTKV